MHQNNEEIGKQSCRAISGKKEDSDQVGKNKPQMDDNPQKDPETTFNDLDNKKKQTSEFELRVKEKYKCSLDYFSCLRSIRVKIILLVVVIFSIGICVGLIIKYNLNGHSQGFTVLKNIDGAQIKQAQLPWIKGNDRSNLITNGKTIDAVDTHTLAVTRLIKSMDNQLIEICISLMKYFSILNNSSKQQQTFKEWLSIYNQNPREFIDRFVEMVNNLLTQPFSFKNGQKITDNITIFSVTEKTWIDIAYDKLFYAVTFALQIQDKADTKKQNLKTNDEQKTEATQIESKVTEVVQKQKIQTQKKVQKQQQRLSIEKLLNKTMQNTIWYLKRVASRGLQALKSESDRLIKIHKQEFNSVEITEEWQQALINECRPISVMKFRCSLSAAQKLIPGLSLEELMKPGSNYVFTHGLSIMLRESIE